MTVSDFVTEVNQRLRREAGEVLEQFQVTDTLDMVSGGKRLRARLVGSLTDNIDDRTVATATAIELLHASTLVHDDIIDHATTRRGQPTISEKYGADTALLVGNALFARATALASQVLSTDLLVDFGKLYEVIAAAQNDELLWRQRLRSEQQYQQVSRGKTGLLFRYCAQVAGAGNAHQDIVESVAYAFQIIDDIDDLLAWHGDTEAHGSKLAEYDINLGNITLPAILALEHRGVRADDFVMSVIDDLMDSDWQYGVDESRARATSIIRDIRAKLKKLPRHASFQSWLEPMIEQLEDSTTRVDTLKLD